MLFYVLCRLTVFSSNGTCSDCHHVTCHLIELALNYFLSEVFNCFLKFFEIAGVFDGAGCTLYKATVITVALSNKILKATAACSVQTAQSFSMMQPAPHGVCR